VSRARLNNGDNASPAQRRQRDENRSKEPTPLPPYEPPICALTISGRRALDELRNRDNADYRNHITKSKELLPNVVFDTTNRLRQRKARVEKATQRRHQQDKGDNDEDNTEIELEDELFVSVYSKQVADLTNKAEKAMRDLIDYDDELAMQETLLNDVSETIASAPVPQPRPVRTPRQRQPRNDVSDEDDEDGEEEEELEEEQEPEVAALSAVELLKKAKADYTTEYQSRTMLER